MPELTARQKLERALRVSFKLPEQVTELLDDLEREVQRADADKIREFSWEFGYLPNQQIALLVSNWLDPDLDISPMSPEEPFPGAPKNYNGPLTLDASKINDLIADTLRSAAAKIRAMPPHEGPSGHKIARTASEAADSIDPDVSDD